MVQRVKSVNDLMPMIGARFYTALDTCMQRSDTLEVELQKDVESTRMLRWECGDSGAMLDTDSCTDC